MKVVNGNFGFFQLDFLLKSDNDELIDKKIDDFAGFYDEINAEELNRRYVDCADSYYCPSRMITLRNLH